MINYSLIEEKINEYNAQFANAQPYSHLIIDGFLEQEIALKAHNFFFPKMEEMDRLKDFRQNKAQDPDISKFDSIFSEIILKHLHSVRMLQILSSITGIFDFYPDPQLYASGLAQGENGSFLNVHIDNSSHPVQPWYRRLNLLIYLNKEWEEKKRRAFGTMD